MKWSFPFVFSSSHLSMSMYSSSLLCLISFSTSFSLFSVSAFLCSVRDFLYTFIAASKSPFFLSALPFLVRALAIIL